MYKRLLPLLVIVVAFTSCNKKETGTDPLALNGKYKTGTTVAIGAVILYTSSGQITDPAIIEGYLKGKNINAGFTFDNAPVSVTPDYLTMEFNNNRVNYSFAPPSKTTTAYVCVTASQMADVLVINDGSDEIPYGNNAPSRCDSLSWWIKSYIEGEGYTTMTSPAGTSFSRTYKSSFRLGRINDQLIFRKMVYSVSSGNKNLKGEYWDLPAFDMPSLLKPGDTVVCQLTEILMTKI